MQTEGKRLVNRHWRLRRPILARWPDLALDAAGLDEADFEGLQSAPLPLSQQPQRSRNLNQRLNQGRIASPSPTAG